MKDEFEEFIDLIEKNLDKCPWIKNQKLEDCKKEILEEANEIAQAIDNKDYENLKEELGDLLWDVVVTAYIAENKGLFEAKEIMKSVKEKIKRRKPFLLEENKDISLKEAKRMWVEAKEKEKNNE